MDTNKANNDAMLSPPDAWYMDERDDVDQREPHRKEPNETVSGEKLVELGVVYWKLDADSYEDDPKLEKIRKDRGYNYQDIITVSKVRRSRIMIVLLLSSELCV